MAGSASEEESARRDWRDRTPERRPSRPKAIKSPMYARRGRSGEEVSCSACSAFALPGGMRWHGKGINRTGFLAESALGILVPSMYGMLYVRLVNTTWYLFCVNRIQCVRCWRFVPCSLCTNSTSTTFMQCRGAQCLGQNERTLGEAETQPGRAPSRTFGRPSRRSGAPQEEMRVWDRTLLKANPDAAHRSTTTRW